MIAVKSLEGEYYIDWFMRDEVAIDLAEAFKRATKGEDTTLNTPIGVFEFKNITIQTTLNTSSHE